jgi:hypothetical protein
MNSNISTVAASPSHSSGCGGGVLFFLFMVYFRLNNEEVWSEFLSRASNPSSYRVMIYASEPDHFVRPRLFPSLLVPITLSEYGRAIGPMNQLIDYAGHLSRSEKDRFIWLSENAIPVKPFWMMQQHFLGCDVVACENTASASISGAGAGTGTGTGRKAAGVHASTLDSTVHSPNPPSSTSATTTTGTSTDTASSGIGTAGGECRDGVRRLPPMAKRQLQSSFCVAPTDQWLKLQGTEYAVKTHQWSTLNK